MAKEGEEFSIWSENSAENVEFGRVGTKSGFDPVKPVYSSMTEVIFILINSGIFKNPGVLPYL